MSIGRKHTSWISTEDVLRNKNTLHMVRDSALGCYDKCYVYKWNDVGYFTKVFEGTMTECSIYMDNEG